jgi:hypothetical protein
MRKFITWANLFPLLLLFIITTSVILNGCKKSDVKEAPPLEQPAKENTRFFTLPVDASPQIKAIANGVKVHNKKYHFLEDFIKKVGYPRWDKAKLINFSNSTVSGRMGTEQSVELVYVPFVKDSQAFVNSVLAVQMNNADTTYRMLHATQYKKFGSDTADHSNWNKRDVFRLFTAFDNSVFGHTKFLIKDTSLFKTANGFSTCLATLTTVHNENPGGRNATNRMTTMIEECFTYMICENYFDYGVARLAESGSCFFVDLCSSYDNGVGSGGGWTGGGGGSSGTGGGISTYWEDPCSNGGGLNRVSTEDIDPQECQSSGWEPIFGKYTDPQEMYFYSGPAIDLTQLFNCFNQIPDNGAFYSIKIYADVPVNDHPYFLTDGGFNPGHSFISLTKTNGSQSITQSFGFYPINGRKSVSMLPGDSKIVNNAGHEYDASMEMTISASDFNIAKTKAKSLADTKQYDLDGYNCTDFAVDVFNSVRPNDPIIVPDWFGPETGKNFGTTPNGLFYHLRSRVNNPLVNIGTGQSIQGAGLCP